VQTLIRELADEGIAVLLISSELDELLDNADRLVVLREGTVVGELTGDEINEPNVMAALAAHADQVEVTDG
jgi:ribose transport system ATP-binding protein